MRYKICLLDITHHPPKRLTRDFSVDAPSREDAAIEAIKRIKKQIVCKRDERVRDYANSLEIWNIGEKVGNSLDCAGFEFDALPGVIREILLDISSPK